MCSQQDGIVAISPAPEWQHRNQSFISIFTSKRLTSLGNTPNFSAQKRDTVWILPIGGCREFGMNATAYISPKTFILVDLGILFPDQRNLGTSGVYPVFDSLMTSGKNLDAYVITHGHEDHIGALPFAYRKWPAPIYATEWTVELIKRKFARLDPSAKPPIFMVRPGEKITVGDMKIEYFPVHHSIPDTCSLIINSGKNRIFHTGDFKFEDSPVDGRPIDFEKLRRLGKEGVDVLLADSTNALSLGASYSELSTEPFLKQVISEAKGRVFITTFASNLWRLQTVVGVCKDLGKKLFIAGRGLENTLEIASKLDRFHVPSGVIIDEQAVRKVAAKNLVVLVSGSQGESRAALAGIVSGNHRIFSVETGDTLVFSSRMIPGNERSIMKVKSEFERFGGRVITTKEIPGIHVSGHGHREDLLKLIGLLNPKTLIPIHGTFSQLIGHRDLGRAKDVDEVNPDWVVENGCLIELEDGQCDLRERFEFPESYIEADSNVEIDRETLRERLRIGESGLCILSGTMRKKDGTWLAGPEIEMVGLKLPGDQDAWTKRTAKEIKEKVPLGSSSRFGEFSEDCRLLLRRKLQQIYNRKPVVLTKIHLI
jgi:ribonuclease J